MNVFLVKCSFFSVTTNSVDIINHEHSFFVLSTAHWIFESTSKNYFMVVIIRKQYFRQSIL